MRHANAKGSPDVADATNRASARVRELERMTNAELERVFLDGVRPDLAALAGWEFRGLNSPTWFTLLGIKKFIKGFYLRDGDVFGYNCPVQQNGMDAPWIAKPSDDTPKRFGFYSVTYVEPTARDNAYLHAVLLDYGKGDNPPRDPSAGLRDYVVQVDADNPDLYLGKAYYAVGRARLPTLSYFILERHRPGIVDAGRS
jgi:hypothetical protein